MRQVTFTPDIMAAGGDSADEEAKEREYKRKLAERRLIERERRAELSQAAERFKTLLLFDYRLSAC